MANTRKDNPNRKQRIEVIVPRKIAKRITILREQIEAEKDNK